MFTGLVETTGTVEGFTPINGGARLTLIIPFGHELSLGDSVAVNGCCLTVDALDGERVSFDLLSQTLRVTSLGNLQPGGLVNLERAMSAMDRFGGHFVMGHVDNTGTITALEPVGQDHRLEVRIPDELARYCIDKGSITIDGISLTIANLNGSLLEILDHAPYLRTHEPATRRSRPAGEPGSGHAGQVCGKTVRLPGKYKNIVLE